MQLYIPFLPMVRHATNSIINGLDLDFKIKSTEGLEEEWSGVEKMISMIATNPSLYILSMSRSKAEQEKVVSRRTRTRTTKKSRKSKLASVIKGIKIREKRSAKTKI